VRDLRAGVQQGSDAVKRTKRTIRRLSPAAREIVRLANDLDRINRRLQKLALDVDGAESDAAVLRSRMPRAEAR
jgi:hypothetical protein